MSPVRFIGLLLSISAETMGQVLLPECSNPQGIYVVEEGSSVEVCFTLYRDENANLPRIVTLSAESRSDLGVVATSNVDYKSENLSRPVEFNGQDTVRLCQTTNITDDAVAERTEYFTVALLSRSVTGRELASCQVAIIDRNGPSDCYEEAVANVSLGQIVNDHAFCFMNDLQNGQCQQELESDRNATSIDCTRWNQRTFNSDNLAAEIITDQILPNIAAADSECVQNIISGMESLYHAETGGPTPPPPLRQECATNCVLTVTNNKNCAISVLLLEQVFRKEAIKFFNDLSDVQTELCTVGLECCDISQPLPSICQESQVDLVTTVVTGSSAPGQGSVVPVTTIAAALGSILGLILVGGAVALILFFILRQSKSPPSHKEIIAGIQVGIGDHQMENQDTNEPDVTTVDRESAIMMVDNSAYMCSFQTHGQDISTDYNVAYYSSSRVKSEDDHDCVYEYI